MSLWCTYWETVILPQEKRKSRLGSEDVALQWDTKRLLMTKCCSFRAAASCLLRAWKVVFAIHETLIYVPSVGRVVYLIHRTQPVNRPFHTWVHPRFFGGVHVPHLFRFLLCCPIMCLYVRSSVLWWPLRFPHKNDVRFVFYLQLLVGELMSYLRYLCLFACNGVFFVLFFVFVLCLAYPMLPVSLDCPFLDCPFGIL